MTRRSEKQSIRLLTIVKIYVRAIRRGARTLESVPASVREAVAAALAQDGQA